MMVQREVWVGNDAAVGSREDDDAAGGVGGGKAEKFIISFVGAGTAQQSLVF